jgi:Protein of unknown function (DUF2914)
MYKQHSVLIFAAFLAIGLFTGNARAQDRSDATKPTGSTPATSMESASSEHVARAFFTSNVQNREPADTITSLSNDKNKIYFFSELTGLGGQTVTHRWEYQGKTMGEIKFNVGGPRWRVWSSKTLLPQWTGEWRVSIIDGSGNKVGEGTFNYTEAKQPQN